MAKIIKESVKWGSTFDPSAAETLFNNMSPQGDAVDYDELSRDAQRYIPNYRRVCPKRPEWDLPFQAFPVHWIRSGANKPRPIGCPRLASGTACPLCNIGFDLLRQEDKKAARELLPKWRFYLNVVRLNQDGSLLLEEDTGEGKIYVLSLNEGQFRGTAETDDNEFLWKVFEDHGDISHIETGRNLEIMAREVTRGDFKFSRLRFSVAEPTPFPGSQEMLEEQLVDLSGIVPFYEPSEMVALVEGRSSSTGSTTILAPGEETFVEGDVEEAEFNPAPNAGGFPSQSDEVEPEDTKNHRRSEARGSSNTPTTDPRKAIERLAKRTRASDE